MKFRILGALYGLLLMAACSIPALMQQPAVVAQAQASALPIATMPGEALDVPTEGGFHAL